jgi:hypothetical protein
MTEPLRRCRTCGADNDPPANFCGFCGGECDDAADPGAVRQEVQQKLLELTTSAARCRRGRVAIVTGEAGSGKTILAEGLAARLAADGVPVFRLEGRLSTGTPLEAVAALLRRRLGVARGTNPDPSDPAVVRACSGLGLSDDDTSRLLDRLSGRASPLRAAADVVEGEETSALRYALARSLSAEPSVLLVADADCMDPAERAWVLGVMESAARLPHSVVVTCNVDPWPAWNGAHVSRMALAPLDARAIQQVLTRAVGKELATPELLGDAIAHSQGSAFLADMFARCARACVSGQAVDRSRLATVLAGGASGLVAGLLEGLPPQARAWIERAAMLDMPAPTSMLAELAGGRLSPSEVAAACSACWFVTVADGHLWFPSRQWSDAVRSTIDDAHQRPLHRAIAKWQQGTGALLAPLEVVAHHWEAAAEDSKAVDAYMRVATDLGARHVFSASARFWRCAADLYTRLGDEAGTNRCMVAYVEALVEARDPSAARQGRGIAEDSRFADMLRARALAVETRLRGDFEQAVRILSRGSDGAGEALAAYAWFALETELADVHIERGNVQDAEHHAALAHDLIVSCAAQNDEERAPWGIPAMAALGTATEHRLHRAATLASSALVLSRLRAARGDHAAAANVLDSCLRLPWILDDIHATSRLLAAAAALPPAEDPLGRKLEMAERAFELARSSGDRRLSASIAADLALKMQQLGRTEAARTFATTATSLAESLGLREPAQRCAALLAEPEGGQDPHEPSTGKGPSAAIPMGASVRPPAFDVHAQPLPPSALALQPPVATSPLQPNSLGDAAQLFRRFEGAGSAFSEGESEPQQDSVRSAEPSEPAERATKRQRALFTASVVALTLLLALAVIKALRADPPVPPASATPPGTVLP